MKSLQPYKRTDIFVLYLQFTDCQEGRTSKLLEIGESV